MKTRMTKPLAALLLAVGLSTAGVAPASAAILDQPPTVTTNDTGWGKKI